MHGFHATTANSLSQILQHGGLKEGKVHVSESHAPWAVLMRDDRQAAACGSYGDGVIVEALVCGRRHAYKTISQIAWDPHAGPGEDWREKFMHGKAGRVFTFKGILHARDSTTQLVAFYITSDALGNLARVTYEQSSRRRRR